MATNGKMIHQCPLCLTCHFPLNNDFSGTSRVRIRSKINTIVIVPGTPKKQFHVTNKGGNLPNKVLASRPSPPTVERKAIILWISKWLPRWLS